VPPTRSDLIAVATEFKGYSSLDLAASIAALQLLPQNSGCLARLEQAAMTAASLSSEGPDISGDRLSAILNNPPCSTSLAEEDPRFDELLAEPIAFPGGLFLVSPGLGRDAVYVAEHLLESLFLRPVGVEDFIAEVGPTCLAALRMSDLVLGRAGLKRYEMPQGSPQAPVVFCGELDELKGVVRLSYEQIEAMLAPHSTVADLEPLVIELGSIDFCDGREVAGRLRAAPIVRHENEYVVALPLALLEAMRAFIVASAVQERAGDALADRFRKTVAGDVEQSLSHLGMKRLDLELRDCGDLPLVEYLFSCDQDKLVYVQVVTDELIDYETDAPYGEWKTRPGLDISLDARRKHVEKSLKENGFGDASVMHLFISQLIGRERQIEFGGAIGSAPSGPQLALSAADLRTISALEGREPLLLFKYAANREANMPADHPLGRMDQLGSFALYRENGYSLRLAYDGFDLDRPFEFIGAGLGLREQTRRKADVHLARYETGRGVKVRCIDTGPIYIADPPPGMSLPLLVEGLTLPIWIHQSEASSAADAEQNGAFQHMVAFWFWQLADDLGPLLTAARDAADPLHVWVDLSTRAEWLKDRPGNLPERGSAQIGADQSIRVEIEAGDWEELAQPDNSGEKAVMRLILVALRDLAQSADPSVASTNAELDAILERGFANPRKKHLLILSATNVELAPGDLPRFRPVQEADRNEVRQQLGKHLQRELELGPGPIPVERRAEVLGTARDWALGEVQRQIAELEPTDLLERLLALNEAVVRQRAMERLKIPTRLACYETDSAVQKRLRKQIPQANLAGIVYRFLVECVVAVPPSGSRPVTASTIDRLAAAAAELQDIAASLDALTTGLSNVGWIINYLGELRLAAEDPFAQAQGSFLTAHVQAIVGDTERSFESHWDSPGDDQDSPSLIEATAAKLDEAFKVETGGLSLLDLRKLVEQLVMTGDDHPHEPKRFHRADLEAKLASELDWEPTKVTAGIDFLMLKPRGRFYSGVDPPAWSKSDVQPWRFNRRLSLNRRPLVLREVGDGPVVLYGTRQLWAAWPLQISYLLMSKFKATSEELSKLLGEMGDDRGKEFESKVAELYGKYPERFEVLRGRDNFGGEKMQRSPDQNLGDIDVLVAIPSAKELVAIEAKDIAMALTPSELADELATHFRTADYERRPAALDRHKERLEWLRQHLGGVLSEFSFPPGEIADWTVDGLFVTDEPVPSAHVIRPELPVVSYRELEAALASESRSPPKRRTKARRS
jgi:hypothetical protein